MRKGWWMKSGSYAACEGDLCYLQLNQKINPYIHARMELLHLTLARLTWSVVSICTFKVPGLNLGQSIGYPDVGFLQFFKANANNLKTKQLCQHILWSDTWSLQSIW